MSRDQMRGSQGQGGSRPGRGAGRPAVGSAVTAAARHVGWEAGRCRVYLYLMRKRVISGGEAGSLAGLVHYSR